MLKLIKIGGRIIFLNNKDSTMSGSVDIMKEVQSYICMLFDLWRDTDKQIRCHLIQCLAIHGVHKRGLQIPKNTVSMNTLLLNCFDLNLD